MAHVALEFYAMHMREEGSISNWVTGRRTSTVEGSGVVDHLLRFYFGMGWMCKMLEEVCLTMLNA